MVQLAHCAPALTCVLQEERGLGFIAHILSPHLLLVLFTVMVSMATRERKVIISSWGNIPVLSQKVLGSLQEAILI